MDTALSLLVKSFEIEHLIPEKAKHVETLIADFEMVYPMRLAEGYKRGHGASKRQVTFSASPRTARTAVSGVSMQAAGSDSDSEDELDVPGLVREFGQDASAGSDEKQ